MIRLSKSSKIFIEAQINRQKLAEDLEISYSTLSNILNDNTPISNNLIVKFLKTTGFGFDKAFTILPDKKDRVKK